MRALQAAHLEVPMPSTCSDEEFQLGFRVYGFLTSVGQWEADTLTSSGPSKGVGVRAGRVWHVCVCVCLVRVWEHLNLPNPMSSTVNRKPHFLNPYTLNPKNGEQTKTKPEDQEARSRGTRCAGIAGTALLGNVPLGL